MSPGKAKAAPRKRGAKRKSPSRPPGAGAKTHGKARQPRAAASKAAEKAKAAVEAKDARGARLSAAKQALRDHMIIARAAQDWTWEMIAAEAGISERQCQRVVKEHRGLRSPLDEAPMKLLEDVALGFKLSIGDFEAMAYAHAQTNPNVALGAKKAANEARRDFISLMHAVGKLPGNMELFRSEAQMIRIAEGMVETLEGLVRGDVSPEEALGHFRELLPQRVPELTAG